MIVLHHGCRIKQRPKTDTRPRWHMDGEPEWLPEVRLPGDAVGVAVGGLQYGHEELSAVQRGVQMLHSMARPGGGD